ncbi:Dimodular nonribosomal peptide synthase [Streptomyces xanthophaeus]|uniref:non-ribosomal peptide synthetase n=1 Tax=Streptomyces xanthophaeus TaxID=67385 RepID=UPI00233E9E94|nr:non-ribosomal peptide synthetase [Streptomyces xanthophaeus]WCD86483.1 Dimodular nonribosomal peptide synthase [Streptomyces xanthophaeus]
MSTRISPPPTAGPAGSAADFFAGTTFDARPARACHSLVRRMPDGLTAELATGRLAAAQDAGVLPAGLRLWVEDVATPAAHPASEALRSRESARYGNGLRAVLLAYPDGAADLVLVAHRRAVDSAGLDLVARVLAGTADAAEHLAGPGDAPRHTAVDAAPPAWGLGDPRRAGVTGVTHIGPVAVAPEPATPVLLAATALVLSRYADRGRPVGLLTADRAGRDRFAAVSLPVDDATPVADLVQQAERAIATAPPVGADRPVPAVGVVELSGQDGAYRPFLDLPFPVTFTWEPRRDGTFTGRLDYDASVLAPEVAAQLARHVGRTAELIGAKPNALDLLSADVELTDGQEGAALLALGRPEPAPSRPATTVHGAFAAIAADRPGAPALSDAAKQLTYAELDRAASRMSAGLAERGIGPGSFVGVCLDRDADLLVTLLAVLKTGAAYVPMDPRYPVERLRYTTEDAGLRLVVTTLDGFPAVDGVTAVRPAALAGSTAEAPEPAQDPDAPAYVIYTSGSTGKPKGVVVPHRNVGALLAATAEDMRLGPDDVWTLFHSSAFDFSVWEIWGCLLTGGHLVVVPYWVSRSPEEFHALLVERRVTVLSQTPSAFASLRDVHLDQQRPLALRLVVFGGEPLDVRSLELWFRREPHDRCRLVNMFGITETTVHVTTQTVTPVEVAAGSRSVGTALPGWTLSVRDTRGRLQPLGVPGEIYVGGAGVADRYLNRPELTAERFVDDPLTGERAYRSGDLGRLRPDGRLDHLGRIDDQVKVRGYRIELGEVRSVLLDDPTVSAGAVVLNQGDGDAAGVRLDAYVVLRPSGSVAEVRRRLRGVLPEHMVPGTVTAVPEIPLTVNGKVDAARLPKPDQLPAAEAAADAEAAAEAEAEAPAEQEGLTDVVLRAWRATLGPEVGPDDDFFELGGNSLLAVRLSAALRREGLPPVPLRDLYLKPTAARLVEHLTAQQAAAEAGAERP